MNTQHRATESHWAAVQSYADNVSSTDDCLLELRDRLAALESGADTAYHQLAARVEAIEDNKPCPYIRSSDEGTSYCALAEETANSKPTSNFSQIRSSTEGDSLVERVGAAISQPGAPYPFWRHDARAAIRAVAAWLRTETDLTHGPRAAEWLEQKVKRHG